MAAIATAIVSNPVAFDGDDPTSDPLGHGNFSYGWAVKRDDCLIGHCEIDDLCEVADVVWVLHEGQMVAQGRPGGV